MKSMLKVLSALAFSGAAIGAVHAGDDQKDLKKVIEDQGINYVETAQKGITLSGYVDTSYTYQFAGASQFGASSQAALRQFDTANNNFNINAVKIALEKALPDKNEWAAGFRIDTIYGADARYLGDSAFQTVTPGVGGSATTNNGSGLALQQALVKFRIPVGNGLDIYAGKFVTFLGYEVIESPANPNFSRGLLFTNAIPLTNTGIYADYKFNDTVEAKLAVVDGWNNSVAPGTTTTTITGATETVSTTATGDSNSVGKAIMGQVIVNAPGKNASITQSFIYSPDGEPNVVGGGGNGPLVVYDIYGSWNPTFVKDSALTLGFNIDLGYNGDSNGSETGTASLSGPLTGPLGPVGATAAGTPDTNTWYGVALYAGYKFTKVFSLNGRAEYLHEDSAANPKFGVGTFAGHTNDEDDFAYTLTASFNIWDNLLTRVEYRIDDLAGPATGGTNTVQNELSMEAVYSF